MAAFIDAQHAQIQELSAIAERYEQVINSRSWRITKPLRFLARNARRIAERLGFQSRRAATLARRTQNSLKVRGVSGTLDRIRQEFREPVSQSTLKGMIRNAKNSLLERADTRR